jgi:SAM-dependent methyltransferase
VPVLSVHPTAAAGYAAAAEMYDRGRPEYPAPAVRCLVSALEIGNGGTVVEVGAGTGKFTRHLASLPGTVVAVEPVDAMRSVLRTLIPGVDLRAGTAESLPVTTQTADAVVCAQSFHWFRVPEALSEFHRVLRPRGRLGLIWNVRDDRSALSRAISFVLEPHRGSTPRYKSGEWMDAFARFPGFGPLEHKRFEWVARLTESALFDRVMSVSCIAILPTAQRNEVTAELTRAIRQTGELAGDRLMLPHVTDVYWSTRREAAPTDFRNGTTGSSQ